MSTHYPCMDLSFISFSVFPFMDSVATPTPCYHSCCRYVVDVFIATQMYTQALILSLQLNDAWCYQVQSAGAYSRFNYFKRHVGLSSYNLCYLTSGYQYYHYQDVNNYSLIQSSHLHNHISIIRSTYFSLNLLYCSI